MPALSAALIVQLLATFGPPAINLITALIAKLEAGGTVTSAEWIALTSQLSQNAATHMASQLTAAGIDPASAQGKAFLALTGATAPVAPVAPPAP